MENLTKDDEAANLKKVGEAARAVGLSRSKLYRAAAQGRLPCYRLDGAVRFDVQELREWMRLEAKK